LGAARQAYCTGTVRVDTRGTPNDWPTASTDQKELARMKKAMWLAVDAAGCVATGVAGLAIAGAVLGVGTANARPYCETGYYSPDQGNCVGGPGGQHSDVRWLPDSVPAAAPGLDSITAWACHRLDVQPSVYGMINVTADLSMQLDITSGQLRQLLVGDTAALCPEHAAIIDYYFGM
jgi:hypothetical protein